MKLQLQAFGLLIFSLQLPAAATIVAGANGGGNTTNNTTAAQYESKYGISVPIYENVIRYSDASGIYLGYNAATKDVWVLTARHITTSSSLIENQGRTVTIDGLVYNRQPTGLDGLGELPGGDLRLVRYNRADLAVPTLPAINISTSIPLAGTTLFTVGYGQNRTQDAALTAVTPDSVPVTVGQGYNWSGTNIKRWGINQIEAEFLDGLETMPTVTGPTGTFSINSYETKGYMTDFDQPGVAQWQSSDESQGSLGDSGGSALYYSGGKWYLSGIYTAVAGFTGQAGSTSAFGNLSLLTDVATYSGAINTALGGVVLIPEPTSPVLVLIASFLAFMRRNRSRVVSFTPHCIRARQ